MPQLSLTNAHDCRDFFQQQLIGHLSHWANHPALNGGDAPLTDRQCDALLRTLFFAMDHPPLWTEIHGLIFGIAPTMEQRGQWHKWNQILHKAIQRAQAIHDRQREITLSSLFGRAAMLQSDPKGTVYHYRRAIRLARKSGDRFQEARACSNLGFSYIEYGHWWRAEVLNRHALGIFEKLESLHGRAHTENHLGCLYMRQQQWKAAELHLQHACEIWSGMDDIYGLIRGHSNLGALYFEMAQFNLTLNHLTKSLHYARIAGDQQGIADISNTTGLLYIQTGKLHQAKTYLADAKATFEQTGNWLSQARALHHQGLLAMKEQKWLEAGQFLQRALDMYRLLKAWESECRLLPDLIDYYLETQQSDQAIICLSTLEGLLEDRASFNFLATNTHFSQQLNRQRRILATQMAA